ncbi:MAG: hypothetical protein PUF26_02540 [Bacteroidales bacterium]|nr:hypothetical protein [Bacteroidales bacterium]
MNLRNSLIIIVRYMMAQKSDKVRTAKPTSSPKPGKTDFGLFLLLSGRSWVMNNSTGANTLICVRAN